MEEVDGRQGKEVLNSRSVLIFCMVQNTNPKNWLERIDNDCHKLSEEEKVELTRIVLLYGIPLQSEEVDLFLNPNLNSKTKPEKFLHYCEIE